MEDGEGGEDESMQEGSRGREETPVQEEREPAFEPGTHEDSHPLPLWVHSLRQRKGEE